MKIMSKRKDGPATYSVGAGELYIQGNKFPKEPGGNMLVYGYISFFLTNPMRTRPMLDDIAKVGDSSGRVHYFRFISVDHHRDPNDMYTGIVKRFKVTDAEENVVWEESHDFNFWDDLSHNLRFNWKAWVTAITCLAVTAASIAYILFS